MFISFHKKFPSYMLLLGAYTFIDFPKFSCLHDYLGLRFHGFFAKFFKSYHFKPNFNHKISFLLQISLFVLKYSSLEPTFSLYDTLIHLHIYCFKPHFPSYTFIWPYMIISFLQIFLPTRLFHPTLVFGTLE